MEYPTSADPVLECCRAIFGIPYPFPWQRLIIAAVLDAVLYSVLPSDSGEDIAVSSVADQPECPPPLRRIAVLPTGAGKSLCWMLPAVVISGLTIAVFPLLSLMADQERRLNECGIVSRTMRGGQSPQIRRRIWADVESGRVKILLTNPEVLQTPRVEKRLAANPPAFLAVDETHTVSQWGESFRPACAGLGRLVEEWNPPAVLALTATAGPCMRSRITELLFNGRPPQEALADPDRPALRYGVIPTLSRNHTLERLVREEQRPLIVFGPTRSSVEKAARMLRFRLRDVNIRFYHAGLESSEKSRLEEWFLDSNEGVLCATCAYGLGVDKKNIRTVVHLSPPGSAEAYLQESGRASRDGKGARAWLISTAEDVKLLDDPRTLLPEIRSDNRSGQVDPERDAIGSTSPAGAETDSAEGAPPPISTPSVEEVSAARREGMIRYAASTDRCRREILLAALGIEAEDCSGCDVCGGESWKAAPEEEIILRVVRWNRGRFGKGQLARILIGRRTSEIRRLGLHMSRGFGSLSGWELEDAEEAILALVGSGSLRYRKWRPGKQVLTTCRRNLPHQHKCSNRPV